MANAHNEGDETRAQDMSLDHVKRLSRWNLDIPEVWREGVGVGLLTMSWQHRC